MNTSSNHILDTIISEVNSINAKVKGLNFLEILKNNLIEKFLEIFNQNSYINELDQIEVEEDIIAKIEDWKFEERLSKEFEAVGFFISDHPLNQFTEIFEDYKINDYAKFNSDENSENVNVAATLLKVQERKTFHFTQICKLKQQERV